MCVLESEAILSLSTMLDSQAVYSVLGEIPFKEGQDTYSHCIFLLSLDSFHLGVPGNPYQLIKGVHKVRPIWYS